jgi:hypothetical protein
MSFSRIETSGGDSYKVTDKILKKIYRVENESDITANEQIDFSCGTNAKGDKLLEAEGEETRITVHDIEGDWEGYLKILRYKSSHRSESVFQYATKQSIVEDIRGMEIKDTAGEMENITEVVDQAVSQNL